MTEELNSNLVTEDLISNGSDPPPAKKKRNLPGNPDPEAEVIALSPKTLMATNRFLCDICGKGFQRDQNLQLHRRGHNLPWKLKQRTTKEVKKRVYVCPEKTCIHNHPSRALGDLTGIKKHFCRKHGEKKWKCEKCSKRYAVQSDWKAHSKTCGTREYKCDCGTIFSRRDSFITHRAFCDALAEEAARVTAVSNMNYQFIGGGIGQHFPSIFKPILTSNAGDNQTMINNNNQIRSPNISLWMGQESIPNNDHHHHNHQLQEMQQIVNSCSNPMPTSYQMNWDFGINKVVSSKVNADRDHELIKNIPLPGITNYIENGENRDVSVPSLFSNQHQPQRQNSPNMSATALLQKAAAIGATTTTTDPSFFDQSFGLKSNDHYYQVEDDENKNGGLYGTANSITSLESEVENSLNEFSAMNQMQMYPPSKRRHIQNDQESIGGGQTRDFLGISVQPICHHSSINGWI